jgi:putative hydroxymethylpyrimidine transport system substrate-binding protein
MHIKVMLEYFYPWTNSAGIYLARRRGWYDEVGLDVECRTYDPFEETHFFILREAR